MPRFAFEAVDRRGTVIRGAMDATTERSVLDQLIAQGHTPMSLRRTRDTSQRLGYLQSLLGFHRFDFAAFLREMGTLLAAGLPVERALVTIHAISTDNYTRLKAQELLDRIRGGEALSNAFTTIVQDAPPHIGRLLAAGEASGQLPEVMNRIANALARSRALKSRLLSDLTYPSILILAMAVVMWVVFHTVLPRLTPLFSQAGIELPLATQILMASGNFFDQFGWALLAVIVFSVFVFSYALRLAPFRKRFDRWLLRSWLVFGIPRGIEAALFCRNLETLLDGGLPLERALAAAHDGVANHWLREQIQGVKLSVSEGNRLSQAFRTSAPDLPPLVVEFAAVGEETGRLANLMQEVSELLDQAVQTRLSRFTAFVVPVTTLIMGALVGGLMAGIVSGILAVNNLAR